MAFNESQAVRPFKDIISKYPRAAGKFFYSYEIPHIITIGGAVLNVVKFFKPPAGCDFLALELSASHWDTSTTPTEFPTVELVDMSNNSYQGNPTPLDVVAGPGHMAPMPFMHYLTEPKYMEVYVQDNGLLRATFQDDAGAPSRIVKVTMAGLLIRDY